MVVVKAEQGPSAIQSALGEHSRRDLGRVKINVLRT
jgi:hypothetical protein